MLVGYYIPIYYDLLANVIGTFNSKSLNSIIVIDNWIATIIIMGNCCQK